MHSHDATVTPRAAPSRLPWLGAPGAAAAIVLLCLPFLLVEVPPLIDMPGHMGAAAIEAAPDGSPLRQYYGYEWALTLNMGGKVLMKLLASVVGLVGAGWWSAVLATALLAAGCLATIRALNPKGGYGAAWALLFVFSYPLLMGFLNYVLATGLALLVFAAWVGLRERPKHAAALLLLTQPVLLICHAVGGALLPLLVAAYALGGVLSDRLRPREAAARLLSECWPLASTVATVAIWRILAADREGSLTWFAMQKWLAFPFALRDQVKTLDIASLVACGVLILLGWTLRARWSWRQGLPALAVFVLFLISPGSISGSALVDVRLLPVALMLALALQDWSGARPQVAKAVAVAGLGLLAVRLSVTAHSFAGYDQAYRTELAALQRVEPGSRVLAFVQHSCMRENWRNSRSDHLASLASLYRGAWVNDNWAVPGLDMLVPKFQPAKNYAADPSSFVWSKGCSGGVHLRSIDQALAHAPVDAVDYVWLIDTGKPAHQDERLAEVWREGDSALYAVRARANVLSGQAMAREERTRVGRTKG
jgi:hypothetical protein